MSYDLHMLEPVAGEDPMETLERRAAGDASLTPVAAERNGRISRALRAANPRLEESRPQDDGVDLIDQAGLEVMLLEEEATISFPYWESLDADRLLGDIELVAGVIASETGWRLYDPQLEQFLDPSRDRAAFRAAFRTGTEAVARITAEDEVPARAPWFKRLFGRH